MTKLFDIKLKAGALQYVIFISVVIALLVFAFIGLTFVNQKLKLKNAVFAEVVSHNDFTFQKLKSKSNLDLKESLTENGISTTAQKKQWGIFEVLSIITKKGKEEVTKTAFIGGNQKEKPALYLQDMNQPLVVVGTTKIEGTTFLPEQGVKQGSIAGYSYINNKLIFGNILKSNAQLIKSHTLERLQQFKDSILAQSYVNVLELQENLKIINAFSKPTLTLSVTYPLDLRSINITGNVIIQSATKITIHKSAKLNDVILIAPEIEIKDKVKGSFQVFAKERLVVGKDVELNYPTALVLLEKKESVTAHNQTREEFNQIDVGEKSSIKGVVSFLSENIEGNYKPQIVIAENAEILGEVYCNQNIELKGTVKGSVYTKAFIANQNGSTYMNHIYNGQILSSELPEQYVGLSFKDSKQNVAKWLYY